MPDRDGAKTTNLVRLIDTPHWSGYHDNAAIRQSQQDTGRTRVVKNAIIQACLICVGASLIGAGVNLVAPWGIPFVARGKNLPQLPDSALVNRADPVPSAAHELVSVTLQQAKTLFDRDQAVFVDARPEFEYAEGHIPGAINIPFDEVEYYGAAIANLDKHKPLVVYCAGESCDLSIHLGELLAKKGFTAVRVFFGGSVAWQRAGFPFDRGTGG
ncbi:MAG: molybdopterin biosynthesis protein MoeB [Candidatus Latescibacteria bacterium ADurb.Bin168]|nr:MAG: molybdopterin biosynthesis protein MoeB [Candidatus Latescibacteria bacterium ADurb.Bin168]